MPLNNPEETPSYEEAILKKAEFTLCSAREELQKGNALIHRVNETLRRNKLIVRTNAPKPHFSKIAGIPLP